MKDSEAVANANTVITIPRQFQKALFKPCKDKDFILNIFDGNAGDADTFMAILNDKAANLSDDFDEAEWVIAKELDPIHESIYSFNTHFLYPKEKTKTYKIDGAKIPSSPYCDSDAYFGYDESGEPHKDVIVDHKLFGLLATINTFDTCGYSDDIDMIMGYMDSNYDLSALIIDTEKKLRSERFTRLAPINRMMSVVGLYLKEIS